MRRDEEDEDDFGPPRQGRDWIPDDALRALVSEQEVHPEESNEATARRLLRENVTVAVMSIAHTAVHGSNERLRLEASKYIVERVLGRVGDDAYEGEKSPVESFIDDVTAFAKSSAEGK